VEAPVPDPPAETPVLEQLVTEESETPVLVADNTEIPQNTSEPVLPETAGHSVTELAAGAVVLGLGLVSVFLGLRRAEA
jgi:hypothetical protein